MGGGSSGNVEITTSGGTGLKIGFTYDCPLRPVVTSFLPDNLPVGTTLIINGNNFGTSTSKNIVYFGKAKASVLSANSKQKPVVEMK